MLLVLVTSENVLLARHDLRSCRLRSASGEERWRVRTLARPGTNPAPVQPLSIEPAPLDLTSVLCRDAPGVGCWYGSFELVKRGLQSLHADGNPKLSFGELMLAGATGGIGFWLVALPFDTLKSVVQTQKGSGSATSAMRALWREGGISRLYRGATVAFGRGIPGAAVVFGTYGMIMQHLT